jgi:hypothetical protein
MKRFSLISLLAAGLIASSVQVSAQVLYKYVDANGKVTYSDKAPKPGEKAERITADTTTNIINSPVGAGAGGLAGGGKETLADVALRIKVRAAERDKLKMAVDAAQANLESAKKALKDGQEPREGEQRIIVRERSNSVLRTDAYRERIEGLEAAVKSAEEQLTLAQTNYGRGAPD